MRHFYKFIFIGLLSCLLATATYAQADRPNIILIIADDLAWDDLGAYGHPTIRTPNIDRLASEGLRFSHAFVTASSCSPSRASLITGRYPHSTDAEQLHWPVPAEQVTFVETLRQSGYWCAAAGKWHLGEALKSRFDLVVEADGRGFQLQVGPDGKPVPMVAGAGGRDGSGCEDWVTALRQRPEDTPFFMWLAALDPHRDYQEHTIPEPYTADEVLVPPYLPDTPAVRADLARYYDEITRLDGYVGAVLRELDREGLADNTLVVFLSDNGRPFPRDKTTLYDGGIRTPLLVRWPGRVPKGTVSASLVSTVDLAPTFLEAAGANDPAAFERFQGISVLRTLFEPGHPTREVIFAEDHWHDFEDRGRAVRDRRYKYIVNEYPDLPNTPPADALRSPTFAEMQRLHQAGQLTPAQQVPFAAPRPSEELFDLERDPFELHNLANDTRYAAKLQAFREQLAEFRRGTNDITPAARTPDEFDRATGLPNENRRRPRPGKAATERAGHPALQ